MPALLLIAMKTFFIRLLCFSFLLTLPAVASYAQDLGALKSSMAQRVPTIDALKTKGAVGENNKGFLEVRAAADNAAEVVAAENRDRAQVYAALAKQTRATVEQVGQARAKQLVAISAPGVWVQRDNGDWYRK